MKLLLLVSLLPLALVASKEDYCSQFNKSCQTCINAKNMSMGVNCYSCGTECKTVDFSGLISNNCELSKLHIWTCSISSLGVVILLCSSSICICCICCGFSCFLCLCCVSACKKRNYRQMENEDVRVKLIGEERQVRRENRKTRNILMKEKYGHAIKPSPV